MGREVVYMKRLSSVVVGLFIIVVLINGATKQAEGERYRSTLTIEQVGEREIRVVSTEDCSIPPRLAAVLKLKYPELGEKNPTPESCSATWNIRLKLDVRPKK